VCPWEKQYFCYVCSWPYLPLYLILMNGRVEFNFLSFYSSQFPSVDSLGHCEEMSNTLKVYIVLSIYLNNLIKSHVCFFFLFMLSI
jgi:hypothetical protein